MATAKLICKLLFYITRVAGFIYAAIVLYAVFCISTGLSVSPYENGIYLHINYPFTQTPFLNVDNNTGYIIFSFTLPLLLYSIFFLLASKVFKVFYQPKLFTLQNLQQLNLFYRFNIFIPLPATVAGSFFVPLEGTIWVLVMVHFILGIFIYLLATIFKRGLQLQNEQDLFI